MRYMTHCYVKTPVKTLDEKSMAKLQALEEKIGFPLIAFDKEQDHPQLTAEQLQQIRKLEKEIKATIIAYNP